MTHRILTIEILSSISLNYSSECDDFLKASNDVVVKVLHPFLSVISINITLLFSLGVSFAHISISNNPDADNLLSC